MAARLKTLNRASLRSLSVRQAPVTSLPRASACSVRVVAAAGGGVDAAEMLASIGIDPDAAWDPGQMIPAERYYDMLERIADQIDVSDLPVRTGASMRLDEHGALGLAFKAATTLGASYARVERYARQWTSIVEYEPRPAPEGTHFILHRAGVRRLGLRLSNEATLASAVSIARQVFPLHVQEGPAAPGSVWARSSHSPRSDKV